MQPARRGPATALVPRSAQDDRKRRVVIPPPGSPILLPALFACSYADYPPCDPAHATQAQSVSCGCSPYSAICARVGVSPQQANPPTPSRLRPGGLALAARHGDLQPPAPLRLQPARRRLLRAVFAALSDPVRWATSYGGCSAPLLLLLSRRPLAAPVVCRAWANSRRQGPARRSAGPPAFAVALAFGHRQRQPRPDERARCSRSRRRACWRWRGNRWSLAAGLARRSRLH